MYTFKEPCAHLLRGCHRQGASNWSLLRRAGDVELNPGPPKYILRFNIHSHAKDGLEPALLPQVAEEVLDQIDDGSGKKCRLEDATLTQVKKHLHRAYKVLRFCTHAEVVILPPAGREVKSALTLEKLRALMAQDKVLRVVGVRGSAPAPAPTSKAAKAPAPTKPAKEKKASGGLAGVVAPTAPTAGRLGATPAVKKSAGAGRADVAGPAEPQLEPRQMARKGIGGKVHPYQLPYQLKQDGNAGQQLLQAAPGVKRKAAKEERNKGEQKPFDASELLSPAPSFPPMLDVRGKRAPIGHKRKLSEVAVHRIELQGGMVAVPTVIVDELGLGGFQLFAALTPTRPEWAGIDVSYFPQISPLQLGVRAEHMRQRRPLPESCLGARQLEPWDQRLAHISRLGMLPPEWQKRRSKDRDSEKAYYRKHEKELDKDTYLLAPRTELDPKACRLLGLK
eukprot:jgi/Mesen1/1370/ME000013S00860